MVEAVLHLLEVEREVAPPGAVVPPQPGLGKGPEVLDAVDVAALGRGEGLPMVDPVVAVAVGDEAIVAGERVRVDGAPRRDPLPDDGAERGAAHVRYRGGVHAAMALQNAEYRDLSGGSPAPLPLPVAAEVRLVHLVDPTAERRLPLAGRRERQADPVVDALGGVVVDADLPGSSPGRHLQGEEADEPADRPVADAAAFEELRGHEVSIRRVSYLY